jgi:ABC-type siderophore export system fused ATPase/permease subunit
MTLHCPDEKCQGKVETMETEVKAIGVASNFIKGLVLYVMLPMFFTVSGVALKTWSDTRAMPSIYATIELVHETTADMNKKIQTLEKEQIELKINSEYTKQGIDDIKAILNQMNRVRSGKPINIIK